MPIREWSEEIVIRCADEELPRAIAALNGSYQPDVYITYEQENRLLSYSLEERSYDG